MNTPKWIRWLFGVAAAYDAVLGIAFLCAPRALFNAFTVTPPNHMGYVQFPALVLLLFAWMFARIAADPQGRRTFILYGIGLKLAFCATVLAYWMSSGVPTMWKPFALADAAMAILFAAAYAQTGLGMLDRHTPPLGVPPTPR